MFTELTGWKEDEETAGSQRLNLWGPTHCVLVVRAFRCECLCMNQPEYIRTVKSIAPSEQALHQAAPVSLERIQTETSKTAKFLGVGVITDQIKRL